jgi:hypothetical protein
LATFTVAGSATGTSRFVAVTRFDDVAIPRHDNVPNGVTPDLNASRHDAYPVGQHRADVDELGAGLLEEFLDAHR